jgi:hypothetical protein
MVRTWSTAVLFQGRGTKDPAPLVSPGSRQGW